VCFLNLSKSCLMNLEERFFIFVFFLLFVCIVVRQIGTCVKFLLLFNNYQRIVYMFICVLVTSFFCCLVFIDYLVSLVACCLLDVWHSLH
jgi:hypothetical protein